MVKILGSLLLVGATTAIGVSVSSVLSSRVKILNSIKEWLLFIHSEIGENLTPLDEVTEKSIDAVSGAFGSFLKECFDGMRKNPHIPFGIIWTKNITHAEYLQLRPQEKNTLITLGNILGRYGAEEQKKAISHTMRSVEAFVETAEMDYKRLGKLYTKLGVICGISLVIVFI